MNDEWTWTVDLNPSRYPLILISALVSSLYITLLPAPSTSKINPGEFKSQISSDFLEAASRGIELGKEHGYLLEVNKLEQRSTVYKVTYEAIESLPVSTGLVDGNKERSGDNKTPEGLFDIVSVEDSSSWKRHGRSAYGPYFVRLDTGDWDGKGRHYPNKRSSIGLHGTDEPEMLGIKRSEGCIRFQNEVVKRYVQQGIFSQGTVVKIVGWKSE